MARTFDLSVGWRLYIYALHGYFSEIMFTALWEFAVTSNPTLMGSTSLWTIPIYGISGLLSEKIYIYTKEELRISLPLRCVIYTVWTYTWEFSTGFCLRYFGACPWNYEDYDWDFWGLICLEYAPLWYIGSILYDQLLVPGLLQLQWKSSAMHGKNERKRN